MAAVETSSGIVWLDELQTVDSTVPTTKNTTKELGKLYAQLTGLFDEYGSVDRLKEGPDTLDRYTSDSLGGDVVSAGEITSIICKPKLARFVDDDDPEHPFFLIDDVYTDRGVPGRTIGVTEHMAVEVVGDGRMQSVAPYMMRAVRQLISGMDYID